MEIGPPTFMNQDTKQLRMMRKKARVSLDAMAKELGLPHTRLRDIEQFPLIAPPGFADRYVEALIQIVTRPR